MHLHITGQSLFTIFCHMHTCGVIMQPRPWQLSLHTQLTQTLSLSPTPTTRCMSETEPAATQAPTTYWSSQPKVYTLSCPDHHHELPWSLAAELGGSAKESNRVATTVDPLLHLRGPHVVNVVDSSSLGCKPNIHACTWCQVSLDRGSQHTPAFSHLLVKVFPY